MWKLTQQLDGAPLSVAVVGVGGTGSEIVSNLTRLHRALLAFGYGGLHVVAFDPDTVSAANIVRQRYHDSDLGRYKSDVLIERINAACGLGWESIPDYFQGRYARTGWDLVISAVDSRSARRKLHRYAFENRFGPWKLWLDTGNDVNTGQVILGTPRPAKSKLAHSLPCATELHPQLMDTSLPDDNAPSCSAMEALERQDLMVNTVTAALATDLLWKLFRHGTIDAHAIYFNLHPYSIASRAVPERPKRVQKKPQVTPQTVSRRRARAA